MNDTLPSLTTDRLVLRPHELTDFAAMHAMWTDPDVHRHIFDDPPTEADTWFRLLRYRGHWTLLGYGYWAVMDASDGRFLGEVGFGDFRRDIDPPFDGMPEAGWIMTADAHGRGLAQEAMAAALGWADANLDAARTVAMITPENTSSIRLASTLGYDLERRGVFNGRMRLIFERPARDAARESMPPR